MGGHTIWPPKRATKISGKGSSYTEKENAKRRTIDRAREKVRMALDNSGRRLGSADPKTNSAESDAEAVLRNYKLKDARLLSPFEVNKIRHIRSPTKIAIRTKPVPSSGIAGVQNVLFTAKKLRECEALIGLGQDGFGKFMNETNAQLESLKSKDLVEIAEIFNERGWKTFTGVSWTADLVGVFGLRCKKIGCKIKVTKSKAKPRKKKSESK